jgi:hypothetical protein
MHKLLLLSGALAVAVPATAQNGANWSTGAGSITTIQFAGGSGSAPDAVARTPIEAAIAFKKWCLDSGGDPALAAAEFQDFGGAILPVSGGKDKPPAKLHIYNGPGAVVAQTDGFFAVPQAQCNVSFYVPALPDKAEMQEAVSALFATPPTNAADAVKKNGKPNKRYVPTWEVTDAKGNVRLITYSTLGSGFDAAGNRVMLVALFNPGATR